MNDNFNKQNEPQMVSEPEPTYRATPNNPASVDSALAQNEMECGLTLENSIITEEELDRDYITFDEFKRQLTDFTLECFNARK